MRRCLGRPELVAGTGEMILLETNAGLVKEARDLNLRVFEEPVVLTVDETLHIHHLPIDRNYPPPAHISQEFVEGVARSGDTYVTIISVHKLIADLQRQTVEV